jgi:hypothetical protein
MLQHYPEFSTKTFYKKLRQNHYAVTNYIGAFLLISVVFGSLTIMRTDSNDMLRLVQILVFFGMGFFNFFALQTESASFLSKNYFIEHLLYSLLIAIVISMFLAIVYFFTNSDISMAFSSGCAFLVPFLLSQAWFFYKHIPKNPQWIWIDSEAMPDELALYFRNKIPIRFQVSRKYFDMKEFQFPVMVSSWVKLGMLFHQFILEQNKEDASRIELKDEDQNRYAWEFYAESLGGLISRQLNPKLNVRENRIMQNSIIVARRVRLNIIEEHDETMQLA